VYEYKTVEEHPEYGTRILKSLSEGKLIVSDREILLAQLNMPPNNGEAFSISHSIKHEKFPESDKFVRMLSNMCHIHFKEIAPNRTKIVYMY
jgi:hypothetical protein